MRQLSWRWFDFQTDLPKWLLAGIGQIIIEWAVIERELEEIIRFAMDADIHIGRITTKGMNAKTRVTVATNLLQALVYYNKLEPKFLSDFAKLGNHITQTTQGKRDMVAHGLWDCKRGKWHVLWLSAQRPTPQLGPEMTKLSRAVLPQIVPITASDLRQIAREIVVDAKAVQAFGDRLASGPGSWRSTRPIYSRRRRNIP